MKIAVTGSSGFIGSKLIKHLKWLGKDIIEINRSNGIDITDWQQIKAIDGFEVLIHLAAVTFVPESFDNPLKFYYQNILGTLNILELCRKNNSKLIYTSSYAYGIPDYLPIDEKHPLKALNPYSQSKIIGEHLCEGYNRDFNLPVIMLRPFNIYGPGQNNRFLISQIISQANTGEIHLKDPRPKRDYIFIDDVIDIYTKCIEYDENTFEIFNIGSGKSYSVSEIANLILENFDNEVLINFTGEVRKNEVLNTVADITKITELLNWKQTVELSEGIKKQYRESITI